MAIGSVSVEVVPDARAFWARFRDETSGQANAEGRRQGDDFRRGVESSTRSAKVRVTGDTTEAQAKLSALEAELRRINIARLSPNFDDKQARAQIAALRAELRGLSVRPDINTSTARAQLAELGRQIKDTENKEKSLEVQGSKSATGLLQALLPLAPALTPLAAAATASAAGLASMAATGIAGFQGLRHEMDLGSAAGNSLNSAVGSIKSNIATLEARAGRGLFVGASKSLDDVNAKLPTLGAAVQRESGILGDALSHVTSGFLHGLTLSGPIMDVVSRDIDRLTIKFDKFVSGPQGATFANTLLADYQQVAPVLGTVATAIGRIIAAGQDTGLSIVTLLGAVADVINAIPLPVLDALVFSFAAIKTSLLLAGPIKAVTSAFEGMKAATAAATAGNYELAASNGALGNAYLKVSAIGDRVYLQAMASAATRAAAESTAAAESASAQITAAESAKAELIANYAQIAAARGGLTTEMQAALAQETAIADEEIANYARVAEAAQASAAEQAAAREEAVATATAASTASKAGILGIIGGVAAAAIGIGLLVTQFHRSEDASAAAAKAAQAYTDALAKGGTAAEMAASLADTVVGDFTKAGLPDQITAINSGLKGLGSSAHFTAAEFVTAVQTGGTALTGLSSRIVAAQTDLHAQIEGYVKSGQVAPQALMNTYTKLGNVLQSLDTEAQGYMKAQSDELKALSSFGIVATSVDQVAKAMHLSNTEVKNYADLAGFTADKNGVFAASEHDVETAVRNVADAYNTATATGTAYLAAVATFAKSAGTSADRAALIGATLKAGNGDALSFASAMNGAAVATHTFFTDVKSNAKTAKESIGGYLSSLIDLRTGTINYSKAGAGPLIQDLQGIQTAALQAASATYQHARATEGGKQAADDAYKVYRAQTRNALIDEATNLGLTAGQAKKLADRYFGMPKKVKTLIEQEGANPVVDVLNKIGTQLSFLTHQPWNPKVGVNDKATPKLHDIFNDIAAIKDKTVTITVGLNNNAGQFVHDAVNNIGHATGGYITGPGTSTSDSVPARLSNGEYVVNAAATSKHRGLLEAINSGVQGFAAGGPVGGSYSAVAAALAKLGATRAGIAGFLGNTQIESSGSTTAHGGPAWGLQQWQGGRLAELQRLAAQMHVSFTSQAAQVAMITRELTHGYTSTLQELRKATSARAAAAFVDTHYEISSGAARGARENAAAAFMPRLKSGSLPTTGPATVPVVATKAITAALFGTSGSFSTRLITAVHDSLTKGITETSKSAAASRAVVLPHAQAVVNSAVSAGVAPALTQAQLVAALPGQMSRAVNAQAAADIAGKNVATLTANVARLQRQVVQASGATRDAVNAARAHATALSNAAHKASEAAAAMSGKTKADKAAKAAAEAHARALADQARAASQAASALSRASATGKANLGAELKAAQAVAAQAKTAYGSLSQAAKDAATTAADTAKQLVAAVQASADALTTTITNFKTSITSGLTQGTDLATVWGTVTANAATAVQDAATAAQNLATAQDAVNQAYAAAADSMAAYTSAQTSVTNAQDAYTKAHARLATAQGAVAAGSGTPAQYAELTAAQQAQSDAVTRLAAANAALASAQSSATATGPTVDQLKALADAQNANAAAQAASAASGTANAAALQAQFNQILANTQTFAADLQTLASEGAGQDLITQVAGLGTTAGDTLAKQLLAAGPTGIKALKTTMASIASVAGNAATQLAGDFFQSGVTAMDHFIAGLEKEFPALQAALAPIAAAVDALLKAPAATVAKAAAPKPPVKQPVKSTTNKPAPKFSAGVTDFVGGLAYVHRDELLVNMPQGTDVITAAHAGASTSGVEARLDAVVDRLERLPEAMGAVTLGGFRALGQSQAQMLSRIARKG